MARRVALTATIAVALLAVSGPGGTGAVTPKRGGTVVGWTPGGAFEPSCLNPLHARCGPFLSLRFAEVLRGAFEAGPAGVRPDLVARVEISKRPPTLTYHIRNEARWSDGVPVSAKDFVFTQQAFGKYLPPDDPQRAYVRSVRELDAKTARVALRSGFAGWKYLFGIVLPRHALQGEDLENVWTDRIDNPKTGAPIGSGPFLLENWERGKEFTLVRNPGYWGPHPAYLARLVLRFDLSDSGDIAEALRSGGLDVFDARLNPETEPDFLRVPGVKHLYGPGQDWEHFEIRIGPGGHRALEEKLVRRALAYGIDRVAIVRAVFGKFVPTMRPTDSAVFLPQDRYYRRNWSSYRYRPVEARRLLAQARCQRGSDGIYVCAGEKLSLTLVTTAGSSTRRRVLELAGPQLRRAGIELNSIYAPGGGALGQILASGDFDVALYAFVGFGSFGLVDDFGCGGSRNTTGYCQRLVTRDLDQADRIFDAESGARVLNRADSQMARDVPVIPLWNTPSAVTFRSTIHGVIPCFPRVACNAENWWRER